MPFVLAIAVMSGVGVFFGTSAPSASAIDQSKGTPGFCPTAKGVTVVVDFQQLGGETIVRCDPTSTDGTGLDALVGAGFQIDGVARWGDAFICRIENRPSAVESIPIQGDTGYHEACIDTPPASAYWSYWSAANNCSWQYNALGVKNRSFVMGGFEGWSFALNATAGAPPTPRIVPVRPGTSKEPCSTSSGPPPTSKTPGQHGTTTPAPAPGKVSRPARGSTSTAPTSTTTRGANTSKGGPSKAGTHPGASTTSTASNGVGHGADTDDPNAHAHFTGGREAANVQDELRKQSKASPIARWFALGAVLALIVGAVFTTRRRRRLREA